MAVRPRYGLSLCSGIGGLDLALERALPGYRTACYVEGEAFCVSNLVAAMEAGAMAEAPVWANVRTFDPRPWRGIISVVQGGYPCQPFSSAGKKHDLDRIAEEDPRHLWPAIADIVRTIEPRLCFFENVARHLRVGGEEVVSDLERMGYEVAVGLFAAEEVGAPHERNRLFILARSMGEEPVPDPSGYALRDFAERGAGGAQTPVEGHALAGDVGPEDVANADGRRLEVQRLEEHRGQQGAPGSIADGHGGDGRLQGPELADAGGARLPHPVPGQDEQRQPADQPGDTGHRWPPGPWAWPERWPADVPPPIVRRSVHGLSNRLDRIRALGNAVVPQQGELAFRTLMKALEEA